MTFVVGKRAAGLESETADARERLPQVWNTFIQATNRNFGLQRVDTLERCARSLEDIKVASLCVELQVGASSREPSREAIDLR
jgi:hypothetical protein